MSVILDHPRASVVDRQLRGELVRRAANLVELLRRNAVRTEHERRIPEENIAALETAGLFRVTQPKRFGGFQAGIRTKLEVIRELGRGDGSTAWVTSLANGAAGFLGMYNDQAQHDVWGENPDARIAGVTALSGTAQRLDDGYRITGRWANASGCLHAHWVVLGVGVKGPEGQDIDQGLALLPIADVTIEDTWHVAGMKGTGSNTVTAESVSAPRHRFISLAKLMSGRNDNQHDDEASYDVPFISAAVTDLVGPQLGLAQAALEIVIEQASKRGINYTDYHVQSDAPVVQLAVAKAASLIDTATLLAYRAAAEVDDAGQRHVFPDRLARARNRMDVAQSVVHARQAIRELLSAHGAASFAETNALQRIWRDSEVASRHAMCNPGICAEVYGRALLGITDGVTAMV